MEAQGKLDGSVNKSAGSNASPVGVWDQNDLGWLAQLGRITGFSGNSPLARAILDTAPSPMAFLDAEGRVRACNGRLSEEAGVSEDQAQGQRLGDVLGCVHATGASASCGKTTFCDFCNLNSAMQKGRQGGEASTLHHHLSGQAQTLRAREYEATVKPAPEAGEGWSICSLEDVSDQRRRRMLERVFFHDMMNRVAALETATLAAVDSRATLSEQRESIEMAQVLARSLREEVHTQQVLMMAEDGRLVPRLSVADAASMLRQEVEVVRHLDCAWGKHIRIEAAQRLALESDPVLVGRVLLNLLKNALEATSDQGEVRCSTLGRDRWVVFAVDNDGKIPPHVMRNLFHRSYSTKGADRGLGLYSVKLLTEKYLNGRVGLFVDGKTVRFEISLPAGSTAREA
jgi:hypothetical protein